MNCINFSRRALIAALLGSSTAALTTRYWMSAAAAESPLNLDLPEAGSADKPSFAVFLALSQIVTLRTQLDEVSARRMYPLFMEEPWGPHHIHSTYTQLLSQLKRSNAESKPIHPAMSGSLSKGQSWFASHLLTTWYLGIYYHERMPPVRVAYAEALMFAAVHPELPIRFTENTGFGKWGETPPTRRPS